MRSALVLISHDRRFLQTLTRATVWLDRGARAGSNRVSAPSRPGATRCSNRKTAISTSSIARSSRRSTGCTYGVSARRKRNMRRVGELAELRQERRDARRVTARSRWRSTEGKVSGKLVIEAERISKSYGERAIVTDFSTRILRGDRVGIVGPNGAGKTTLHQPAHRRAGARRAAMSASAPISRSHRSTRSAMLAPRMDAQGSAHRRQRRLGRDQRRAASTSSAT